MRKKMAVLGLAGLLAGEALADESAVMNFETRLRKRQMLEFHYSHPNGIDGYRINYEPTFEPFTIGDHLIKPGVVEEIKSNTFLASEEKAAILGHADKINSLLNENEKAEAGLYGRISEATPAETTKEQYLQIVKNTIPRVELENLLSSQARVYELALELFDYVKKTDAYQTKLTETERADLFHTINPEISSEGKLSGYFKTQIALIEQQRNFWRKAYTSGFSTSQNR
ncbi:MAG TPA: hypothetical protein VJI46_06725 [Candidatus Nanoarchaeia archaeon]|nr:hypothetical protein [Candidatus Nanoarchaeia archaeon]